MKKTRMNTIGKRTAAWLLALVMTVGLLPAGLVMPVQAAEAHWASPYLEKLVSWGVMRGDLDGNLAPNRDITRAEFVTMINRAYGYDEVGSTPFADVRSTDWFYQDVGIAYKAGYFFGTSANTASPNGTLTREAATLILGRNMMLQESVGESLDFTDSRTMSDWSRGIVKSAAANGVVGGYPDGTFRPQNSITRGEVAALLVSAVGTPIQQPGEYSLGGVYGNVTISASGVTLRNTTIAGDLYITGGVGLGFVTLENVTVLGKIVASGAGESNKGDNSLILRNVKAEELVVDSLANQFVTLRAEGDTQIDLTSVRTSAYLEDVTPSGQGLTYIELNGESGIGLELAGSIGEVVNLTPNSSLVLAQGSALKITVDEKATGSRLTVENAGEVKTLNLDVGTVVTGTGDVDDLNVNANGSTVSMLPDTITVRPGVEVSVGGEKMDTVTAAESSADPRILSGYPSVRDVAPTSATTVFSTNKKGTVYWAVSAIADGSVSEEDLIKPPAYASKALATGTTQAAVSGTEYTGKISKLTSDGDYYLSAVMVDARGQHSPVKVTSFSTPDDTVPNFASGYPTLTKITKDSAQVMVMPTKSCQLYYALLPKGSTAPKAADFKAGAVTGNLGYGTLDVTKNTTQLFPVNRSSLRELETYDLYLWLTDFDGAKSSAVKKMTFTTVDGTPPVFTTTPTVNSVKATSVGLTFNLTAAGTVYWVAVAAGAEYPKPAAGTAGPVAWDSAEAKLQVSSGMNAIKSGRATATAGRDGTINITGLKAETAYDVYYVAVDKAGNYSERIGCVKANTLDENAPTVTQSFSDYNGNDRDTPRADTDITLTFSEAVQEADARNNPNAETLLALYQKVEAATTDNERTAARNALAAALRRTIKLYDSTSGGPATQVVERSVDGASTNWVIDYRFATVALGGDGKMAVTFPTDSSNSSRSALNLSSGSTYYFEVEGLADTSTAKNTMGHTQLKRFTTVFAQVDLKNTGGGTATVDSNDQRLDVSFELTPQSTQKVADGIYWDMLIWSNTNVSFNLFRRIKDRSGATVPGGDWIQVGTERSISVTTNSYDGLSLSRHFTSASSSQPVFERLNQLKDDAVYEYGIQFTKVEGSGDFDTWSQTVSCQVSVAASSNASNLSNLSANVTPSSWESAQEGGEVISIGNSDPFTIRKVFTDQKAPVFVDDYPTFEPVDTGVTMRVLLDRPGTVYYVVAPLGSITTRDDSDVEIRTSAAWETVPESGKRDSTATNVSKTMELNSPGYLDIITPRFSNSAIKSDNRAVGAGVVELQVEGLQPNTEYLVYYVLKGTGQIFSDKVMCYRFKTEAVTRPIITLEASNPEVSVRVDRSATVDYLLVVSNFTQDETILKKPMNDIIPTDLRTEWERTSYSSYTVMDALLEDYKVGDVVKGSVFDYFADQGTKNQLSDLIRNRNTNGEQITMKSSISMAADQTQYVNCTPGMSGITHYTFLAVGKSDLGSGDAFRAIRPVFLRDSEPPKIVSASLRVDGSYPTTSNGRFNGSLTLTFDKPLYWNDLEKATRKIVRLSSPIDNNDDYVTQGFAFTFGTGIDVEKPAGTISASTPPTNVISFKITAGWNGSTISSTTNLSNATGITRSTPLTITIRYELVGEGDTAYYQPVVDITPAWDARPTRP